MTRRYAILLASIVVAALALTFAARRPRATHTESAARPAVTARTLTIEIADGALSPEITSIAKGERVHLVVANRGRRAARLELGGYSAVLAPMTLDPSARWEGEFEATLPGDDFPWLLDGEPAGRLRVTGSHLEEGHR